MSEDSKNRSISVGCYLVPKRGTFQHLRDRWIEAEELGADSLWTWDHLIGISTASDMMNSTNASDNTYAGEMDVFEATTIMAAMAATTSRAKVGCSVMCNAFRNPNLTAFISSTIDHISNGRYILGIGSGYFEPEFEEFGFEYGSQVERSEALARNIPVILDRFTKVQPSPVHHIPLMIGSMGERIGIPLVARYADMWQPYGPVAKMREKIDVLKRCCDTQGRDFNDIELSTFWMPEDIPGAENSLDEYVKAGFTHLVCVTEGPDWDLSGLREALQWRDSLGGS